MSINTVKREFEPSLRAAIRSLMDEAASAQKYQTHAPGGDYSRAVSIPVSTVRSKYLSLASEDLVGLFDKDGQLRRTPAAAPSSETVKMETAILANSRVANAGAGVVIMPDPTVPLPVGRTGVLVMETIPGFVRNVEAAQWSTVDVHSTPSAEVPQSAAPIKSVEIDWNTATAKAVSFKVSRRERIRYGDQDKFCDEIIAAITLGLARAADEVLLSALTAANLDDFALGKAAAQGLRFDELQAISGTLGQGTSVGEDGILRAAGIRSELTGDMEGTIVGAWNRAAVAVRDDAMLHMQHTGLAGEMVVTAWASMQAEIPDASKFWKVA